MKKYPVTVHGLNQRFIYSEDGATDGATIGTNLYDSTGTVVPPESLDLPAHEAAPDPHPQYVLDSEKGAASGVATLGVDGKVPSTQLPESQPLDSTLTALSGQNWVADAIPVGTGTDTVIQVSFGANTFPAKGSVGSLAAKPVSDFGLSLIDDVDAATARATLGTLSNGGDTGTGNYTVLGDLTVGLTTGGSVATFTRPGTSPDGSNVIVSSPGGTSGVIFTYGTLSRSDIRANNAILQLGTSTTTGQPTRFLNVKHTSVGSSADNTVTCGEASLRWSVVYAGTGTINTSDAREKTLVEPLTPAELAAAKQLATEIGTYKFLASVAEKGAAARSHIGMTVQRCIEIMQSHGLDPFQYGFICYDEWPELPEIRDADTGEVTQEHRPAGSRYSFRPDQLTLFIVRGLDARIAALEAL